MATPPGSAERPARSVPARVAVACEALGMVASRDVLPDHPLAASLAQFAATLADLAVAQEATDPPVGVLARLNTLYVEAFRGVSDACFLLSGAATVGDEAAWATGRARATSAALHLEAARRLIALVRAERCRLRDGQPRFGAS